MFNRRSKLQKKPTQLLSADVWAPILVGILVLMLWDILVRITHLPPYILPGPILVFKTYFPMQSFYRQLR